MLVWPRLKSSDLETRRVCTLPNFLVLGAVVDQADRHGIQVVELLAALPLRDHEARFLEHGRAGNLQARVDINRPRTLAERLGQRAAERDAVLERVARTRRRLRPIGEHLPRTVGAALRQRGRGARA